MNYRQSTGQLGERLARQHLISRGYSVIETNPRASYKEIDIIARYKDKIIFVEVKTRASRIFGSADEAMSQKKINNLKVAAAIYLDNKKINNKNIRFDFIAVDIDRSKKMAKIKHFKDII